MSVCVYVHACVHASVCVFVCMCARVCVCVCVCDNNVLAVALSDAITFEGCLFSDAAVHCFSTCQIQNRSLLAIGWFFVAIIEESNAILHK